MTPGQRAIWSALYAASWHASTGRPHLGHFTDEDRARWCAAQADRAMNALLRLDKSVSDFAGEVIG